jgi:predicted ATPase
MINTRKVIPDSLEHALLASRVVEGLEELKAGHRSENSDAAAKAAVRYFHRLLGLYDVMKDRRVSRAAWNKSMSYRDSIRAIGRVPNLRGRYTAMREVITGLMQTAKSAQSGPVGDSEGFSDLERFFKEMRDEGLDSDRRTVEKLSLPK